MNDPHRPSFNPRASSPDGHSHRLPPGGPDPGAAAVGSPGAESISLSINGQVRELVIPNTVVGEEQA